MFLQQNLTQTERGQGVSGTSIRSKPLVVTISCQLYLEIKRIYMPTMAYSSTYKSFGWRLTRPMRLNILLDIPLSVRIRDVTINSLSAKDIIVTNTFVPWPLAKSQRCHFAPDGGSM